MTKALTHVERALKLDPKNQEAHFLLAGLHVGLNQLKEAIESYERVLALNPENREARLFLATLYAQQRRFPEAINAIQRDFEKLVVITHIDELKDAFPVRIDVWKTANGSQVEIR